MNEARKNKYRPTVGLALSGSGNRSTFYIGFLEKLKELDVPIDYISACSGGSLIAAVYAGGKLEEFKALALTLNNESFRKLIGKRASKGGLYSLDAMEDELRKFTNGLNFEEVRPLMSFVTVDIESGEQVDLCMGDIARAARVSCTLPGIFEPVKWGSRTLVDGGLLSLVPISSLKKFPVDIVIGINMRGTKHIFTEGQITLRKFYNLFKKLFFIDEMGALFSGFWAKEDIDFENNPGLLSVLGKSMDLAIKADKQAVAQDLTCDLMITPNVPKTKKDIFSKFQPYYELGRQTAAEYAPKIKELIRQKAAGVPAEVPEISAAKTI
ncbi:MAG: patatin-like phospholipase family protein [Patescibacteria group bacterium]|nr:patatin-like phospholipase family protein [Patescibacteria group bacterium]